MSILMVNDQVDFNTLKEELQVTDGNLASHMSSLEKQGYIAVLKSFVGKKPHTNYSVTKVGQKAFKEHIAALEKILKGG
jgi:DNA-binding MarR family transcriptional regulator